MAPGARGRTVVSRRDRPAKPPLTRAGIIAAALEIMQSEGLGKVTMRRIAAALDTGPASLYVYVRDTEDLHAQILDALLAALASPPSHASPSGHTGRASTPSTTWRDRLKTLLTSYMLVLYDHPEIARMAMSTHPSGPNYLALVDHILSLLAEGGVPGPRAAWAVDLLLQYATATAAEQGSRASSPRAEAEDSALAAEIAAADAARYPHLAALAGELLSGPGPARFGWGLDVLLDGLLATRKSPEKPE